MEDKFIESLRKYFYVRLRSSKLGLLGQNGKEIKAGSDVERKFD